MLQRTTSKIALFWEVVQRLQGQKFSWRNRSWCVYHYITEVSRSGESRRNVCEGSYRRKRALWLVLPSRHFKHLRGWSRATKPKKKKKKKKKKTTKNVNKTSNLSECEDSLASTTDEEQQGEEVLQGDVEDLPAGKRRARRRLRSCEFNITLKRTSNSDRPTQDQVIVYFRRR